MAEQSKPQAQPVQNNIGVGVGGPGLSRRDEFALHLGAALLNVNPHRTPLALARDVTKLTDEFLAALDAGVK